ncbi:MAG: SpoIIE family protein phosphatase [Bacteroidota bacterium]
MMTALSSIPIFRILPLLLFLISATSLSAQSDVEKGFLDNVEEARTAGDKAKLGKALYDLGDYYYRKRRAYTQAVPPLKEALVIFEEVNSKTRISDVGFDLGVVYYSAKDYSKSQFYLEKIIPVRKQLNNPSLLADAYLWAGKAASGAKNYTPAIKHLEEALELGKKVGRKTLQQKAYEELASAYAHIGDSEREREARELARDLFEEDATSGLKDEKQKSDSTLRELNRKTYQLNRQERRLAEKEEQIEQKTRELDSLTNQVGLQITYLDSLNTRAEQQSRDLAKSNRDKSILKNTTIIVSLILLLALGSAFLLYRAYKARVKLNEELAAKNEEIEAKRNQLRQRNEQMDEQKRSIEILYNKVSSSINYAQRIQFAMLPSLAEVQNSFPESFVYFQPRDPVSGDFYWLREVGDKTVVAVADCTGHGVPGAFMSLIGNDLLNTIIIERKVLDPAQILKHMNEGVRQALKQDESKNNDGMDIALCVVDKKSRVVEFAGAKNPLYYLTETGDLNIIKGDKHPIGGTQGKRERNYSSHTVKMDEDKPYHFYLFSDGYQDQFGGKEGRKFLRRNFKSLITEIHQKPMNEQSNTLEDRFNAWMKEGKGHKQIDDVLVIGFRI